MVGAMDTGKIDLQPLSAKDSAPRRGIRKNPVQISSHTMRPEFWMISTLALVFGSGSIRAEEKASKEMNLIIIGASSLRSAW